MEGFTFTGMLTDFGGRIEVPDIIRLTPLPIRTDGDCLYPITTASTGSCEKHWVQEVCWRAVDGTKGASFGDLLFDRHYILPNKIETGMVLVDQHYTIRIWNGNDNPITIRTVSATNAEGTGVALSTPISILEYSHVEFSLDVYEKGPTVIEAVYTFVVENSAWDSPLYLNVTGSRILLFGFPINWKEGVTERDIYLTSVITSYDEHEQRIQLRGVPRKEWEYSLAALSPEECILLDAYLWGYHNKKFALPVWSDGQYAINDMHVGDTEILLPTTSFRRFAAGGYAVIYADAFNFEVVEITQVTATSLKIKLPIQYDWSRGAQVYPIVLVRVPQDVELARPTVGISTFQIAFSEEA